MLFLSAPSAARFNDEVKRAIDDAFRGVVEVNVQALRMDYQSSFLQHQSSVP